MIPKGNQRGGGQQLATHLSNAFDNEQIELADLRGTVARDLHGGFAEWHAQASATRCKKYLYSLSVNPDHRQGEVTRDQYMDFINRTEKNLGLTNQPRAVVFHVKNGREHAHVVWSRIQSDKMRAVQLSHDRQKLRTTAQEFARDHGILLPEGMQKDRGAARFADRVKRENLTEKQQQERTGVSKADRRKQTTEIWKQSDSGPAFVKALEGAGYYLCKGDRRAYVVADLYGEIHSLSRQLDGITVNELNARLIDFPLDKLPPASKAQDFARRKRDEHIKNRFNTMQAPTLAQRRQHWQRVQAQRRTALNACRDEFTFRHHAERGALRQLQQAQNQGVLRDRLTTQPKGLAAFLQRVTGIGLIRAHLQRRQDVKRTEQHRQQVATLDAKHDLERQELARQSAALRHVENREKQSLNTALRREEYKAIARPEIEKETEKQTDTGKDISSLPPSTLSDDLRRRAAQRERQNEKGRGKDPGRER